MAQRRHLHPGCITLSLAFVLTVAAVAPAHADIMICNRMSYVVTAAIGLEDKTAAATRGWFRIDPGDCRTVLLGGIEATSRLLVHAEALPIYGAPPLPQHGQADLCISRKDFIIPAARVCTRPSSGWRASPRSSHPRPIRVRHSISPRRPAMTTSRRGSPAFSGSWCSPVTTPTRSTASTG
jgi:uncharacterized membrane protein